jgi:hypothetical protein
MNAGLREAELHLANCESCLDRVLASEHSMLAFNSLDEALLPSKDEPSFHLSKAELTSYLSGTYDEADGIIYTSHLEDCEKCEAESHALSAAAAIPTSPRKPVVERVAEGSVWPRWPWLTPARAAVGVVIIAILAFALYQCGSQRSSTDLRSESPVNPSTPVAPGSEPTPQPRVTVPTPPSLAVLKDNNREIRLEQDGKLTGLEDIDDATQRTVIAALKGEELGKPRVLEDLSSPKIELLGTPGRDTFQLISPLARVITEDRPAFRWRALQDADSYVVSVFDENLNRVARSPSLTTTTWTSNVRLKRGQRYSWEVRATRDGKEIASPTAPASAATTFRILDGEQTTALASLKRLTPASHFALGIAYGRAGLVADAQREFRQVVKENPDSEIAKKLLRTVQGWK